MKDYSAMSDFDIQQAVLQETWGNHPVRLLGKMMLDIMLSDYDPCNNPADAWPIIESAEISLIRDLPNSGWTAFGMFKLFDGDWGFEQDPEHHQCNANPLRAAMIVYLMMKDAEKCDG